MAGPVYLEPATTKQMVARASKKVLASNLRGPLMIISKAAKVIPKLKMVSAIAPVCTSTWREGPDIICLYFSGMNSMMANAPPAAPAAWWNHQTNYLTFSFTRNKKFIVSKAKRCKNQESVERRIINWVKKNHEYLILLRGIKNVFFTQFNSLTPC